jgi:hypothetical protein
MKGNFGSKKWIQKTKDGRNLPTSEKATNDTTAGVDGCPLEAIS